MIKRYRNLQISNKIIIGLSALVLLNFVVAIRIFTATRQATANMAVTQTVRVPSAAVSAEAQSNLLRMQSDLRGFLVLQNSVSRSSFSRNRTGFESNLRELNELSVNWTNEDDVERLAEVQEAYDLWLPQVEELFDLTNNELENRPAIAYEAESVVPLYEDMSAELASLEASLEESGNETRLLPLIVQARASLDTIATATHAYGNTQDNDFRETYNTQVDLFEQAWSQVVEASSQLDTDQQSAIESLDTLRGEYVSNTATVFELADRPDSLLNINQFNTVISPQTTFMLTQLRAIATSQQLLLSEGIDRDNATLNAAQTQTIALGMLALNVGILLAFVFQKLIAAPVVALIGTAEEISKGNLHARAIVESDDEVGRLAATLNHMTAQLANTIETLEVTLDISREMIQAHSMEALIEGFFEKLESQAILGGLLLIFDFDGADNVTSLTVDASWSKGQAMPDSVSPINGKWSSLQSQELKVYQALPRPYADVLTTLPDHLYATVPLWAQSRQLGTLLLMVDKNIGLKETDLTLINQNLGQVAIGVENQLLFRAIAQRAQDLAAAMEEAKEANLAKNRFLATMSHELRTPLNGILGYAKILEQQLENQQHLERLRIIQDSGSHLLTLINDVLDISKIEAGKLEIVPNLFSLETFLKRLLGYCDLRVQVKTDCEFEYIADPDLPPLVYADEKRLRQILLNLLGNAFKFTDEGTIRFEVRVKRLSERKDSDGRIPAEFKFIVADEGIGIKQEDLNHIFEPFEQAGEHRTRKEGTGLGLAISNTLAEAMSGSIHVESTLGAGSTFTVTVPLPASWENTPENETAPVEVQMSEEAERLAENDLDKVAIPNLPQEMLDNMFRLIELGEITQLRRIVQDLAEEHQTHEDFFRILRYHIDRFDEVNIANALSAVAEHSTA